MSQHYSTPYCWYVIGLLTVVNVFNYMDRMALAVLLPAIKADLLLTDAQLGLLTGFSFALFYAICGIPIARLADRGVRRTIIALALATWSTMTAISGAAQSFWHLFIARVGVGAGESGCLPPAQSILCDYVPYPKRPGVFAIHGFGLTIGAVVGMALAGKLVDVIGWRWTFVVLGVPGIVLASIVWLTLREPKRGRLDRRDEDSNEHEALLSFADTIGILRRCRTYVRITGYGIANGFLQYGLIQWWPSFYERVFRLSSASIGAYLGLAMTLGTAVGLLIGGLLANKAARHDVSRPFVIGIVAAFLVCPVALISLFVSSHVFSLIFAGMTTLLLSIPIGLIAAAVNSVIVPRARATAAAITIFLVAVFGYGPGPLGVGLMSDLLTPDLGMEAIRYALIVPVCAAPLMAALLWAASRTLASDLEAVGAQ